MSALRPPPDRLSADARLALALCAVDPVGLGGMVLRAGPGPARDGALALLTEFLPEGVPMRRMPPGIGDDRLLGGIDLTATLRAGRLIAQRGLIAEADGGLILVAMAERLEEGGAARLARALDEGGFRVERDGLTLAEDSRFGVILLDESEPGEDGPPPGLVDRLALRVDLTVLHGAGRAELATAAPPDGARIAAARARLARVGCDDSVIEAFCEAAAALGIGSLRAPLLALRVARAAAALDGVDQVGQAQAELAARLVLAPRATALPAPPEEDEAEPKPPPPPPEDQSSDPPADTETPPEPPPPLEPQDLADVILEAAKSALPPGMLAALAAGTLARKTGSRQGRAGQETRGDKRGRPIGSRRGALKPGARLHLLDTLRAAAPWQPVRARERGLPHAGPAGARHRLDVRPDDIRIRRLKQRAETATVFVVDASGSAAFQRLAEAKGAVERLLADCYVRRDTVAMLTFGGRGVEVALPPTRSLARAKSLLAGLPGGGGTPLGAAIDAACLTALAERKRGRTAVVVFLTDGRANLTAELKPDREAARAEAEAAARRLARLDLPVLFLDISPRPRPEAESLAKAMRARYLALPYADSRMLAAAVAAADGAERGPS